MYIHRVSKERKRNQLFQQNLNCKILMSGSLKCISNEYQKPPGSSLLFSLPRPKQSLKPQRLGQLIDGKMRKQTKSHYWFESLYFLSQEWVEQEFHCGVVFVVGTIVRLFIMVYVQRDPSPILLPKWVLGLFKIPCIQWYGWIPNSRRIINVSQT